VKKIKRILWFIMLLLIIAVTVIIGGGYGKYKQAISLLPIEKAAEDIRSDAHFTPISEISSTFVNAMVSVEDRRFYKHKGTDFIAIGRALKTNLKNRRLDEGGSSITQQLAKNMYFMNDRSLSRKVAEVIMAAEIEKKYSKKEILELYFNVIYYGSGYYGIESASKGYFDKVPALLSDYEATLLAGIPNAPSVYSLDKNPHLAKERQKKVLSTMVDMKYITKKEAEEILDKE
jgi:membrane peptidoglycan carboxypeptidase